MIMPPVVVYINVYYSLVFAAQAIVPFSNKLRPRVTQWQLGSHVSMAVMILFVWGLGWSKRQHMTLVVKIPRLDVNIS